MQCDREPTNLQSRQYDAILMSTNEIITSFVFWFILFYFVVNKNSVNCVAEKSEPFNLKGNAH